MRRDCDDGDYVLARAVGPGDAVGAGRLAFGVGFKDVFTNWAEHSNELVGVQSRIARVGLQLSQGAIDGLSALLPCRVSAQRCQIIHPPARGIA